MYACTRCGGVVTAWSYKDNKYLQELYPSLLEVDEEIPERAKELLAQAISSLSAPVGAVMLSASAVDAMLRSKNYTEGSLYTRINKAVEDNLITQDMALWAHEVRLDANDQRHVDEGASFPSPEDARRVIDFTKSLGMFLFVLPARVKRGRENAKPANQVNEKE